MKRQKICNGYVAKVIPLAFDESMSYYECICNITNHINKEIIPLVEETNETVIELKNYVDDNMLTKDVDDLTYYTKTSDLSPVAITGDYDDLTDKPTIPDVSEFITKNVNDLTYYTLTSSLSTVATTGSYSDLTNKPTIPTVPTNISAFNNDSGYITKNVNDLTNYTLSSSLSSVATSGSYNDLSNKPTIPTVPTNISAFNNDSGYITKSVNDLTNYTLSSSLSNVATSGSYSDLTNTPTIPTVYDGSLTLKRNGNVVQIFTANNQSDLEADFSVPDISSVDLSNYFLNSWSDNGSCVVIKIGSVKILSISVRNGTTDTVITNFPSAYLPTADVVLPAQSYSAVGYAILRTNGTLTFSSGFVNNGSNVLISAIYL